ncbi:hypothetical protein [Clostridium hydrogeniformans]|uniref:hypothetical protein n=1 Tax=Clostridium hydrogeniformans TaxID=349933 RepID=UPI000487C8B7|nr:hypothetical protein [Clostridium hydrogeniformans]
MERKKNLFMFFTGLILMVCLFFISFYVTAIKIQERNEKIRNEETMQTSAKELISSDAKINLYIKDRNGNSTKESNVLFKDVMDKLQGKYDLASLQSYYQTLGYYYRFSNSEGYVFEKRFTPNRYYISVYEDKGKEYFAIFKADGEGKLIIENKNEDISSTTITKIPTERERDMYRKGYGGHDEKDNINNEGFESKEDAFEALSALTS